MTSQMFPVIYRSAIYFLSSAEARDVLISNPEKFLAQTIPKSSVPVRLAIIGPPKCGKSTGLHYINIILHTPYVVARL